MAVAQGLVDLSLFDWAPASQNPPISLHVRTTSNTRIESSRERVREFYGPGERRTRSSSPQAAPSQRTATKSRPSLPCAKLCQQTSARSDDGSQCVLKRLRRTGTSDSANSPSALLQRRNLPATPQLTLSVPQSSQETRPPASSMVWMPDEQMWLVISEEPVNYFPTRTDYPGPSEYPTPPEYTPRVYPPSEPITQTASQWEFTPPPSPVQCQLQSLLQPRDDERLSPLFQEAMSSVPLTDTLDLPPPPSYEGTMRQGQPAPRSATLDRQSRVSSLTPSEMEIPMQRAQTTTGHRTRARAQTTTHRSSSHRDHGISSHSYNLRSHTAASATQAQFSPAQVQSDGSRQWFGLAKKIARPRSAT